MMGVISLISVTISYIQSLTAVIVLSQLLVT